MCSHDGINQQDHTAYRVSRESVVWATTIHKPWGPENTLQRLNRYAHMHAYSRLLPARWREKKGSKIYVAGGTQRPVPHTEDVRTKVTGKDAAWNTTFATSSKTSTSLFEHHSVAPSLILAHLCHVLHVLFRMERV